MQSGSHLVNTYLSSVVCKLFVVSMSTSAEELRFRRDLYFVVNKSEMNNA